MTPGLVVSARTNTYSPYLVVGDEALGEEQLPEAIRGTDVQEVLTNLPFASSLLTGLFLHVILSGPDSPPQPYDRTLVDRIGYAARQGAVATNVSVDPNGPPTLTSLDLFTLNLTSGKQAPGAAELSGGRAERAGEAVRAEANPTATSQVLQLVANARSVLADSAAASDEETANLASGYSVAAYFAAPRVTMFSSRVVSAGSPTGLTFGLDLVRDAARAAAAPGQSTRAPLGFATARGIFDSYLEAVAVPALPGGQNQSSAYILRQAAEEGISRVVVGPDNLSVLQTLDLPAEVGARISADVRAGLVAVVPTRAVAINGTSTAAWWSVNPTTGEVLSRGQDGGNQSIIVYVVIYSASLNLFLTERQQFVDFLAGRPHPHEAQELVKSAIVGGIGVFIPFTPVGLLANLAYDLITTFWPPLVALLKNDPAVPDVLVGPDVPFPTAPDNSASMPVAEPANRPGGPIREPRCRGFGVPAVMSGMGRPPRPGGGEGHRCVGRVVGRVTPRPARRRRVHFRLRRTDRPARVGARRAGPGPVGVRGATGRGRPGRTRPAGVGSGGPGRRPCPGRPSPGPGPW